MSKRHQSNRRKSYGRRQHELHERRQREHQQEADERDIDDPALDAVADRFSFLDPRTPRLHYALGELRMAVYQGARQRTVVLPRRPRVDVSRRRSPSPCRGVSVRSAVRARSRPVAPVRAPGRDRDRVRRARSSRCPRTSASRRPATRSTGSPPSSSASRRSAERPPQRAQPPGQGARDPQARDRRRPRAASRARRHPGALGAPRPDARPDRFPRPRAARPAARLRRWWRARSGCGSPTGRSRAATSCRRWPSGSRRCGTRCRPAGDAIYDRTGTVVLATSASQRDRLAAYPQAADRSSAGRRVADAPGRRSSA